MGHLERNFTGTPSSRHCDARALGKMVFSCSSANGLKCFACRLIGLLITTDKIGFDFFLAILQSFAVFTTTPGNCRCRQRFRVDRLTVTYTGLLTLRKSDTWWMKARHTCKKWGIETDVFIHSCFCIFLSCLPFSKRNVPFSHTEGDPLSA